ncbi:chemotaxis protein CheW [Thalassoglobus sp.]|uniref:chemotaxis protein CheW n=1 Tax=Thalassoglobus sp. TaxID=2795869 RepID=UPI003AA9BA1E
MTQKPTYCVFRRGSVWLALPAQVIREVMPRPKFVSVPRTNRFLSGLSHIRSEFVPVLNLSAILPEEPYGSDEYLMIIEERDGDWGLLVDELDTLVELEPSNSPEELEGWDSTVIGWATYNDNIIRILDSIRIYELASRELNPAFQSKEQDFEQSSSLEAVSEPLESRTFSVPEK